MSSSRRSRNEKEKKAFWEKQRERERKYTCKEARKKRKDIKPGCSRKVEETGLES